MPRKVDEAKKRLEALSALAGAQSPEQAQSGRTEEGTGEVARVTCAQNMKPKA